MFAGIALLNVFFRYVFCEKRLAEPFELFKIINLVQKCIIGKKNRASELLAYYDTPWPNRAIWFD
jgi:hypothetical protein